MGLCHSSSGLCHFVPKIATMRGGFILSWTHGGGPWPPLQEGSWLVLAWMWDSLARAGTEPCAHKSWSQP